MRTAVISWTLWFLAAGSALAGGYAANDDFVIQTAAEGSADAGRAFAEQVLERASQYRSAIATEWLGAELPPSVGRTYITVLVSDAVDRGRTLPKSNVTRDYHHMHLTTSRDGALGATLAHEIAHTVLATRYSHPQLLPAWVTEGIASRYDDQQRQAKRQQILEWYVETDNWPELQILLDREVLPGGDQQAYAQAVSVTEFLVSRGDKAQFLQFVQQAASLGWDGALAKSYGIENVRELNGQWQSWVRQSLAETPNKLAHDAARSGSRF